MPESFYTAIINEIFDTETEPLQIEQIVSKHYEKSSEKGIMFYVKLIKEISSSKRHNAFLRRVDTIYEKALVNGKILYQNLNAAENEPCIIIGLPDINVKKLIIDYHGVIEGKDYDTKFISMKNFIDKSLEKEIQIISRKYSYSNDTGFSHLSSPFQVGDDIVIGHRVLSIEKLDFNSPTLYFIQKMTALYQYCNENIKAYEIEEALKNVKQKEKKVMFHKPIIHLKELWLQDLNKYERLIKMLKSEHRGTGQCFVNEVEGKYYWNMALSGSQKYLVALLYYLHELNFINYTSLKDSSLKRICQITFNINKLDPNNFTLMRSGKFDKKYEEPFIEFLTRLQ